MGEAQLNTADWSRFYFRDESEKRELERQHQGRHSKIHASQLSISLMISVCTNGYLYWTAG